MSMPSFSFIERMRRVYYGREMLFWAEHGTWLVGPERIKEGSASDREASRIRAERQGFVFIDVSVICE
jgi:hypothetical protein